MSAGVSRRALLAGGVAGALAPALAARAHGDLGPLDPPRPAPALPLLLHDGRSAPLTALLQGRITAVQLMFTGCSATCPIQGAVFAELQQRLAAGTAALPAAQLLSISIDPLSDDAAALAAWRRRFGAGSAWLAAAPPVRHADVVPQFLGGRALEGPRGDRHNTQVYLFDARGRLAFRTADLPGPRLVADAMAQLAARRG